MTGTHVRHHEVPGRTRLASYRDRLATDRVLQAGLALIVLQLAFRAWATYGAWFAYDDFAFISRMRNEGLSPAVAGRSYAGHVMPAGMYLTWLADVVAPFDFRVPAFLLLGMQALADVGLLVLLVRLFGSRRGILVPLALYLSCAITIPIAIWWAAGVNQLPMQVVLFWALACHVSYLHDRQVRHAVAACAWLLVGLAFYEKVLLVLGAIGLLSLCYFATGPLRTRLRSVWQRYRAGIVMYTALGLGYLAVYVLVGLNFSPGRANNDALGQVVSNMVLHAWAPAVVGGPLDWQEIDQFALPAPGTLTILASLVVVVLIAREIHRCRANSRRAWLLPGFFLGCNILLVAAGRASFVGAQISLDFRYQGELSAVTAIAVGCAVLPIRGAAECATPRARSELVDHPRRVAGLVAAICVLATVSSVQYVQHWNHTAPAKAYFDNLLGDLDTATSPVPLVDAAVPDVIMWPIGYPLNLQSYLLRAHADSTDFVESSTDHLSMVDQHGHVAPVVVPDTRRAEPGPRRGCGYRVAARPVAIPLDGPVAYGGWWVRIGYIASGDSPVRVRAGDAAYTTEVEAGLHALYLKAGTSFDEIEVSDLAEGVSLCTDDVTVGRPVPRTEFAP
jgi:hypothetical protein